MTIRFAIVPWFDSQDGVWRETLHILSDKHDGTVAKIHYRREGHTVDVGHD